MKYFTLFSKCRHVLSPTSGVWCGLSCNSSLTHVVMSSWSSHRLCLDWEFVPDHQHHRTDSFTWSPSRSEVSGSVLPQSISGPLIWCFRRGNKREVLALRDTEVKWIPSWWERNLICRFNRELWVWRDRDTNKEYSIFTVFWQTDTLIELSALAGGGEGHRTN